MTRQASNRTTATNYALEGEVLDEPSIPAISGPAGTKGPWLEILRGEPTQLPDKYILTKTHCGGFCKDDGCQIIHSPRSFLTSCLLNSQAVVNPAGDGLVKLHHKYNRALVAKAIHMVRHPLDNIVARFHLVHNIEKDTAFLQRYPKNRTGFRRWCREQVDQRDALRYNHNYVDHRLRDMLRTIPCSTDFFQYVQWHNLAFTTTHDHRWPVLVVHYEDYATDLDRTRSQILNFLELESVGAEHLVFRDGKVYRDYYTMLERTNIQAFVQEFSTADTWKHMQRYDFELEHSETAAML